MKLFPQASKREQGNTLVFTIVVVFVLGLLVLTHLTLSQGQHKVSMRSQAWNLSIAVVEAGVEEAMAHLNHNATNSLAIDGWQQANNSFKMSRWIGQNHYVVIITNFTPGLTNLNPIIISRGYVPLTFLAADAGNVLFAQANEAPRVTFLGRGVRLQCGVDRIFARGMVARDGITLNGNNVETDSFDSTDPTASTNGLYDVLFRRAHGDIASNLGISNSVTAVGVANANIMGSIATGPLGTVEIGPQGSVGDLDWHKMKNNGIQEGHLQNDMNMSFPTVQDPFLTTTAPVYGSPGGGYITNVITVLNTNETTADTVTYPVGAITIFDTNIDYSTSYPSNSPGPITTNYFHNGADKGYYFPVYRATYPYIITNTTITWTYYDYIFDDGNYKLSTLDGTVHVRGKAIVYVTDSVKIAALTNKPGESLNLYSSAPSVALAGNTTLNTDGRATSFRFWGMPSVTEITFTGNASFTGTIYAPNAALKLSGSGNNTIDFVGASVTRSVDITGHFRFHYDESLGRFGPDRGYYITSWTELEPEEVPLVVQW